LSEGDRLMCLGYAKLGDYAQQRLGIGTRFAQELRTLEARLASFPMIQAAYANGSLTKSKVRALLAAIGPEEETEWVARAREMTVRQLSAELKKRPRSSSPLAPTNAYVPDYVRPLESDLQPRTIGRWLSIDVRAELAVKWKLACEIERRQVEGDVP